MSRNIPSVKRWKVTFYFAPRSDDVMHQTKASEYVEAPTKLLALWAAREQRYGCFIVHDPACIRETVSLVRGRS